MVDLWLRHPSSVSSTPPRGDTPLELMIHFYTCYCYSLLQHVGRYFNTKTLHDHHLRGVFIQALMHLVSEACRITSSSSYARSINMCMYMFIYLYHELTYITHYYVVSSFMKAMLNLSSFVYSYNINS